MTFTAVGSNNECIWGSKLDLKDSEAVKYAAGPLESKIPSSTKSSITLPTVGAYDTTISWSSNLPSVLSNQGIVNRTKNDVNVALTVKISKGKESYSKTFNVLVKGKLDTVNATPIYKYDFNTLNGSNEILSSGSKEGKATLAGTTSILEDQNRGKVLNIKNAKGAINANYLALPNDTLNGITNSGYTVGMWVNIDTTDPNYFEHSALFEANGGGKYPVTRISANLFSVAIYNTALTDQQVEALYNQETSTSTK